MKILLLNDNPVVNKLVTLSAQKTSDELEVVEIIDSINEASYDLLIVDDMLYESELFTKLQEKITFNKSLYICARDASRTDEFTRTIKKPFLPTDLVELFSVIGKELTQENSAPAVDEFEELNSEVNIETENETEKSPKESELEEFILDEELSFDDGDEIDLGLDDDLLELDEITDAKDDDGLEELSEGVLDKDDLQEVQELLDSTELNAETSSEDDLDLEMDDLDLELDDLGELSLEIPLDAKEDDLDLGVNAEISNEAETSEEVNKLEELSLEDDLELDDLDLELDDLEEELSLEIPSDAKEEDLNLELDDLDLGVNAETSNEAETSEEVEKLEEVHAEISSEDDLDLKMDDLDLELDDLDEELSLEIPLDAKEEDLNLELDDSDLTGESIEEELSLESEIEKAVGELSQEDLDSEIDENTLLDIASNAMDDMESLNSRDIKLAIGEEVSEETSIETEESPEVEVNAETSIEAETSPEVDKLEELIPEADLEIQADNDGVKALKKLLEALSNKDVAASMKGMKISINIELGDK